MPSSSSLFSPPITHRRSWSSRLHSRISSPHYVCITLSSSFQTLPHSRSTTAPASYIEVGVSSGNRMAISTARALLPVTPRPFPRITITLLQLLILLCPPSFPPTLIYFPILVINIYYFMIEATFRISIFSLIFSTKLFMCLQSAHDNLLLPFSR